MNSGIRALGIVGTLLSAQAAHGHAPTTCDNGKQIVRAYSEFQRPDKFVRHVQVPKGCNSVLVNAAGNDGQSFTGASDRPVHFSGPDREANYPPNGDCLWGGYGWHPDMPPMPGPGVQIHGHRGRAVFRLFAAPGSPIHTYAATGART